MINHGSNQQTNLSAFLSKVHNSEADAAKQNLRRFVFSFGAFDKKNFHQDLSSIFIILRPVEPLN